MTGTLLGWVLNTVILCINMMYSTLAIYGRLCVIMVRITGMSGISVVSSLLKLDGVNAKGDAKVHIGKRVNVREEHARGAPKTCIRAIWRRNRCGHSNAGVVLAMFILFLRGAASAPFDQGNAASDPVDSVEYAKQLAIAEAKISRAFSWQRDVILLAAIFALGAVLVATCVLCISIGCYIWIIGKDITNIRKTAENIRENQQKARDERKHAQNQPVLEA